MCIGDNIMKNRLKDMRLKRGISQKILGIEIGVSQQNISKYENDAYGAPHRPDLRSKTAEMRS